VTFKTDEHFREQHRHARPVPQVEMDRILGLPVCLMPDEDDAELFSAERMRPEAYVRGLRFRPAQVAALRAWQRTKGGLFPIGVGDGKTLIAFMIANEAFMDGMKKGIYLVPAGVAPQVALQQLPFARRMMLLSVPVHFAYGRSWSERVALARSGAAGLYVLNYSHLSQPDANDVLAGIAPGYIIADEAHRLKNPRAALTKRVFAAVDAHDSRLVAMSGTMGKKKLLDVHHLSVVSLRDNSPLPRQRGACEAWGQHLDSGSTGDKQDLPASLRPLVEWARERFPDQPEFLKNVESLRRAFRLRMNTSPGVVSTGKVDLPCTLMIENRPVPSLEQAPGWDKVAKHLAELETHWRTPDGDEIEHGMLLYKWRYELHAGFYNSLVWPDVVHMMRYRLASSEGEAAERVARARVYHAALQSYHKLLRGYLDDSPLGLDTPMQVGRAISKGDQRVPSELVDAWHVKEELDFEGRPERIGRPVYLSDARIMAAIEWAASRDGEGSILWWFHNAVGARAAEIARSLGVDLLFCPAGPEHDEAILSRANAGKVVIASMSAHGEGKNLQHFGDQCFLQWPREARLAEQTIGRTHRQGQERDELVVTTMNTTEFDHMNYAACLLDAVFAHQVMDSHQRIVFAGYDPLPMIFSPEFLHEQGFNPTMLSADQRQRMEEHFGKFVR